MGEIRNLAVAIFRSIVTVDPQNLEWAVDVASASEPAEAWDIARQFQDAVVIDFVQHSWLVGPTD